MKTKHTETLCVSVYQIV